MEAFFQNPDNVIALITAVLSGSTGIGAIILSCISGKVNKKYSATVASVNAKDTQIEELKAMIKDISVCVGLMMSAFSAQQLSSLAITADTKKLIVSMAEKVEKLTDIKLDSSVKKAIDIMTTINPAAITEQKKEEIFKAATIAQDALEAVNQKATDISEKLIIE